MQPLSHSVVSYPTNKHDGSIRDAFIRHHELSSKNCGGIANYLLKLLSNFFSLGNVSRMRNRIAQHEFNAYKENIGKIRDALMAGPNFEHTVELSNQETIFLSYGIDSSDGTDRPYVETRAFNSDSIERIQISNERYLAQIDADILENPSDYPEDLVNSVRADQAARENVNTVGTEVVKTRSSDVFKKHQRLILDMAPSEDSRIDQSKRGQSDVVSVRGKNEKVFDVALD
jgi:hypothetical protein